MFLVCKFTLPSKGQERTHACVMPRQHISREKSWEKEVRQELTGPVGGHSWQSRRFCLVNDWRANILLLMLDTLISWIIFPLRDQWNLSTLRLAGRSNEIMWRIANCFSVIPNHQGRSGQDRVWHSIVTQCSVLFSLTSPSLPPEGMLWQSEAVVKSVWWCEKRVTDRRMCHCFKDFNHTRLILTVTTIRFP